MHEDIDAIGCQIWVTHREGLENRARVKNKRGRAVAVLTQMIELYDDYITSDEYLGTYEAYSEFVFCNIRGGRIGRGLTAANAEHIRRGLVRRSGVQFTWHMFRHTHASEIIASGYSLLDTAERLGHADPQTTNSTYKHLLDTERQKVASRSHADLQQGPTEGTGQHFLTDKELPWL